MKYSDQRITLLLVFFVYSFFSCQNSSSGGGADQFPTRPITFLVPWAAGGMTDLSSRALAAVMQKHIGKPVNVINRTGGGGVIGHLALSQARPDGYTIGAVTVEITLMHNMGLTELTYQDFTPLGLIIDNAASITVRADSPFQNLQDLVAQVKANPGTLKASGTARGAIWDLARIGFLNAAGLQDRDMPWVPSQGAAPAMQELIAGGVDVVTASMSEVDALRQAGQVKTLAVMADERLAKFPNVPTVKESGIDWQSSGWVSVCAPKGLDPLVKQKLETAIKAAMEDPEFINALTSAGSNIRPMQGDALMEFLQNQNVKNSQAMEMAGLKHIDK
ncbi:MAG: tripartite tricarboxylate transporter substrate binding protein [Saprospiraceae bacterium]|nr:tripartite tricarboxylate transporter substrate binding protein [Saprospiraceae bacterium]